MLQCAVDEGGGGAGRRRRRRRMRSASTSRVSKRRAQPARGGAGGGQQLGERAPLAVPGAGGALVLLDHRGEQRRDQARAPASRSRARRSRRPGCACAASTSSRRPSARAPPPTSVWLSRTTSSAALPTAPAATPSAPASSPIRPRSVCQGSSGVVEAQVRACTAGFERADRPAELVRRARTLCRRSAASSRPTIQPAAFRPNVVGWACWSSVRPMIGVSRCVSASCAAASAAPRRSSQQRDERALGRRASRRCRRRPGSSRPCAPARRDGGLERLDHRAGRVADLRRARADLRHVVAVGVARAPRSRSPRRR